MACAFLFSQAKSSALLLTRKLFYVRIYIALNTEVLYRMSRKYNQKLISGPMLGAITAIIAMLVIFAILLSVFIIVARPFSSNGGPVNNNQNDNYSYPFRQEISFSAPNFADDTVLISSADINSSSAAVLNVTDNVIIASRKSDGQTNIIYPASMTKVMTLIVVFENLKSESSLNDVITISEDVVSKMEEAESSGFGLKAGEKLTVKDLIYVMMLQSDNIACETLARYIAESDAAFVTMMNKKAEELGLSTSTTLFQNCTGLHHQYHYTTCKDMATIMAYAMKNTFCAEVLTAKSYTPSKNFRPGDGCTFWNAFLVHGTNDGKISPKTAEIIAGKTGFTDYKTSGQCLVSFAKGADGKDYIVVTAKADSPTNRLNDHLYLYDTYAG